MTSTHVLPEEILDYVMFLVGCGDLESLKFLEQCKQVNSDWNRRIKNSLENPSRKWGPIVGRKLLRDWGDNLPSDEQLSWALDKHEKGILPAAWFRENLSEKLREKLLYRTPTLQEIKVAASLAEKALLGDVNSLFLNDVDLASDENLASLVTCVTRWVILRNVGGGDLVKILQSVRSKFLAIYNQNLDSGETQALVQAMENYVEEVLLQCGCDEQQQCTLDIKALTQYSGKGRCRSLECCKKYHEQLSTWAKGKDWKMEKYGNWLAYSKIKRN